MDKTKIVNSVGIVVIHDGKVLLVKHGEVAKHLTGTYGTPAGRIDSNETSVEAAVRELEEETGLVSTTGDLVELPKKYIADIERKSGKVERFNHTVFVCKKFSGNIRATDEVEPEWIEIDKLKDYNLLPNIEDMVLEAGKLGN